MAHGQSFSENIMTTIACNYDFLLSDRFLQLGKRSHLSDTLQEFSQRAALGA
jgi:hypothetical protein